MFESLIRIPEKKELIAGLHGPVWPRLVLFGPVWTCMAGWDFIWQRGSAADQNVYKLNRKIGRKSRVFVAFWNGIRKSFLLDRNKSFQKQKTKNANRNLVRI